MGVLIEGLRASGDEVVEINEPLRLGVAGPVAVLRQPWRLPVLAATLARCWLALVLRALRHRAEPPVDAVLVGHLGYLDVRLARLLFPHTPIVLDHLAPVAGTPRDRGRVSPGTLTSRVLRAVDDGALRRADIILVDTAEHAGELPEHAARRAVVVPVGAPTAWFVPSPRTAPPAPSPRTNPTPSFPRTGAAPSRRTAPPPWTGAAPSPRTAPPPAPPDRLRAIFVGLFPPSHGTATLGAALAKLAGDDRIAITVVGRRQDHPQCRQAAAANPMVRWIDWVPHHELPELVAGHDVCLGIFDTTTTARSVVPAKVVHGAAAGCAVVTSDTPPQRRALGSAALFVPPGDPSALAAALRELAADRDQVARLRAAARARAADQYTPATVVAPVRRRLAELSPTGKPSPAGAPEAAAAAANGRRA
jgi:glycosyltransferase involved in cell wall biosynthesis